MCMGGMVVLCPIFEGTTDQRTNKCFGRSSKDALCLLYVRAVIPPVKGNLDLDLQVAQWTICATGLT